VGDLEWFKGHDENDFSDGAVFGSRMEWGGGEAEYHFGDG
jgi:hypothetical protein